VLHHIQPDGRRHIGSVLRDDAAQFAGTIFDDCPRRILSCGTVWASQPWLAMPGCWTGL
jgi:hypothetical protein